MLLEAWYTERFGRMTPDLLTHANGLNFATLRELIDSLVECYLAELSRQPGKAQELTAITEDSDHATPK